MQIKKIFVGGEPQAQKIIGDALEQEFNLVCCDDLDHAKLLLAESVDAIVCTVQFSSSSMFDLLHYVKTNPATKSIPFVGVRALQGALPIHEVAATTAAVKLLGADEFTDLHAWMNMLGREPAFERLRIMIRRLL